MSDYGHKVGKLHPQGISDGEEPGVEVERHDRLGGICTVYGSYNTDLRASVANDCVFSCAGLLCVPDLYIRIL